MKSIIAVLVMLVSLAANAFDVEASIGETTFDKTNGVFYWEDMPHKVGTTSPAFSIGIAGYAYGHRIRAGYEYIGRVTQESTIYTSMEAGRCPSGYAECGKAWRWNGYGTNQALYLQWEPEYKAGAWRLFGRVGPKLVKSRFYESIRGLEGIDSIDSPHEYRIKWTGFAVGVEYKNVALVYQHQPVSSSSEVTFVTVADTVSMQWRF